jgi:hypothetical protein
MRHIHEGQLGLATIPPSISMDPSGVMSSSFTSAIGPLDDSCRRDRHQQGRCEAVAEGGSGGVAACFGEYGNHYRDAEDPLSSRSMLSAAAALPIDSSGTDRITEPAGAGMAALPPSAMTRRQGRGR